MTIVFVIIPSLATHATQSFAVSDVTANARFNPLASEVGEHPCWFEQQVSLTQIAGDNTAAVQLYASFDANVLRVADVRMGNTATKTAGWTMLHTQLAVANEKGALGISLLAPNAAGRLTGVQTAVKIVRIVWDTSGLVIRDNPQIVVFTGYYSTDDTGETAISDIKTTFTPSYVTGNLTPDNLVSALDAWCATQVALENPVFAGKTLWEWGSALVWPLMVTADHRVTASDAYAILEEVSDVGVDVFAIDTANLAAPSMAMLPYVFNISRVQEVSDGLELIFEATIETSLSSQMVAGQLQLAVDPRAYDIQVSASGEVQENLSLRYCQTRKLPFFREGEEEISGEMFRVRFKMPIDADIQNPIRLVGAEVNEQPVGFGNIQFRRAAWENSALLQNYPNPFNPETWIPYRLAVASDVTISIFNQTGRLVRELALGGKAPGFYIEKSRAAYWDGRNQAGEEVASGMYFYQLEAGRFSQLRRAIIVK